MENIPKFHCSACGNCCSKISGFISDSEREFIEEFGHGRLPLVQIIPSVELSFPLWDFEAKRFREYEKETKIDAKIRPCRGIFDLKSNKFIVVTYQIHSNACPFLDKVGKCEIYQTKRAFICHLFPFNRSPFLAVGKKDQGMFGVCPNTKDILDKLDYDNTEVVIKQLYESFGETFLAAVQHDYVIEWSNRLILELLKNKLIRPAINYPYELLKKRIENAERIDLTDFLVDIKYATRNEIKALVKRFEGFADARDRLLV